MIYTSVPEIGAALRLHLNENTAGCSPAVLAAIRSLDRTDFACYPDYSAVTRTCEAWFGVPEGWVQLTNGLDEGLQVAAHAASRRAVAPSDPRSVIIVEPAFEMYAACADAAGLAATHIPAQADFGFPVERILAAISPATRVIYLTDPNNPTGLAIPQGAIERIAQAAPWALVFVDEAYADFSGRTCIGRTLERRPNVVVGRTFAKAHGLAALRVGALIASPDTLMPIRRLLPPYSLNICAVRALEAALDDRAYLEWYAGQVAESRQRVYDFCDRLGLAYWRSEANFVLLRPGGDPSAVVGALAARGIQIRDRSNQPGCEGCVRITAGVVDATVQCLDAMEDVLATRAR